jgi:hypothetical protein
MLCGGQAGRGRPRKRSHIMRYEDTAFWETRLACLSCTAKVAIFAKDKQIVYLMLTSKFTPFR